MFDVVETAANALHATPCPGCGAPALRAPAGPRSPCVVTCAGCDREWDVLAEVTVVSDTVRLKGSCCSGFRHHELAWTQEPGETPQTVRFQTWAQEHVLLRAGDVVSILFAQGDLLTRRRRPPMPLIVADHTRRRIWALVGAAPVVGPR